MDDPVERREESGRIVIEPMRHKEFDLDRRARKATRKANISDAELAGVRGKLRALLG